MNNELFATIDLGSNSFRLLIAKVREDKILAPVDQIKETVRLAAGLDEENKLSDEAIERGLDVLSRFAERIVGFKKSRVRAVATSTLRVAVNANKFIEAANKILGFTVEVISGLEEARLIYIGATHSLAYSLSRRLIIDIGGGSTEFILGKGYDPEIMESMTIGCVSYNQRYFNDGNLTKANFDNAIFAARSRIQVMEHMLAKRTWESVVGTSGTAKTFYDLCMENNLAEQITLPALHKLKDLLIGCKNINNCTLNGLKDDRKPVVAGGLAIMIAIMEELHIESMTIADGALREGVMYDLLGRRTDHDLRVATVENLKKRYEIDEEQSKRVSQVALSLYNNIIKVTNQDTGMVKLLNWATELHEIGLSISHNDYHKHGAYILANSDLAGFSRPEQKTLADLVRSHRGNLIKIMDILNSKAGQYRFLLMILVFRLSVILNRNRKNIIDVANFELVNTCDHDFHLCLNEKAIEQNPLTLYSLEEEVIYWAKFNINIAITSK